MVRILPYILLLLGVTAAGQAPRCISLEVRTWANFRLATTYSGWDAGRNGGAISVGVNKPLNDNLRAKVSGEAGAAGIGNYVAGRAGICMPVNLGASRWEYTPGFHLLQGMALSRPGPLYMWGLEQTNGIDFRLKNSSGPGFVLGFRLYGFPGYSQYSRVHTFFDLNAGVRYTF